MTTLTPSCEFPTPYFPKHPAVKLTEMTDHAEQYSPDDNRFDLRPFLYPSWFGFKAIEKRIAAMEENETRVPEGKKNL